MAVNPSPLGPKPQLEIAAGSPAVGNRLFFYVAGSVGTKQNSYTDSTGGVANTNPVVLDALGFPTNTEIWFTAGQAYKIVYAPPGSDDPPNSPIWTIDNLLGQNDVTGAVSEWAAGPAPTFINATSFSLVGDQTGNFQVGRRIKTTNTSGTIYSTILTSAFAAVTTVTVVNDSGVLDSGLSAVSYGIESATNPAVPLLIDTFPLRSGSSDKTKKVRLEVDGLTTGVMRVLTVQDSDDTLVGRATTDTLTNKTLSAASNTLNLTPITNSLGADVALNNTGNYFDGPSVAQGTVGTWFVSGTVTVTDTTGIASIQAKLWDGTTIIASGAVNIPAASFPLTISLSGFITSPVGNLRISCKDATTATGKILFNSSANSKDSTITAIRVG